MQAMHCRRLMEGNSVRQLYDTSFAVGCITEDETKQLTLTPATAAPLPAKVSLQNKLPVLDPRLRISTSKVRNVVPVLNHVPHDLFPWTSPLALIVVDTVPP